MANKIRRIKSGMGGSSSGRGRSEKTAVMKEHSKTERRRQQDLLSKEGVQEIQDEQQAPARDAQKDPRR